MCGRRHSKRKAHFSSSVKPSHASLRTGDMGRVRGPESRGVNDIEVNKVAALKKLFTGRHNTGREMGPQSSIFFFSIKPNPRIFMPVGVRGGSSQGGLENGAKAGVVSVMKRRPEPQLTAWYKKKEFGVCLLSYAVKAVWA